MPVSDYIAKLKDSVSARVVFGDAVERDGVTVIPAAYVVGGGGAGGGTSGNGEEGQGMGVGLWARPVGAYVIKDGDARWVPAVDPYLVIFAGWIVLRLVTRLLKWYSDSR